MPEQTLERHILLGERYNGNIVKLYESNSLVMTKAVRQRRLNPRRWRYLIIPQGIKCPCSLDFKQTMIRTP